MTPLARSPLPASDAPRENRPCALPAGAPREEAVDVRDRKDTMERWRPFVGTRLTVGPLLIALAAALDAPASTVPATGAARAVALVAVLQPRPADVRAPRKDVTPPSSPSRPTALDVGPRSATIAWASSGDDVGVTGYRVFRDGAPVANTPRVRFADEDLAPSTAYAYAIAAYDAAGNVSTPGPALVVVTDPAPLGPAYPLAVSDNRRYLVDRDGTPFLMTGDSPQGLIANLSEAEAEFFFANREAAGFNAMWVNLLCATYTGGRPDGSTYDGIIPFVVPGDLATPNEAYFERVDAMLDLAAAHGLLVLLDPAETGSFLSILVDNGVEKCREYGRYLGARYRGFDNVLWMSGNDFQSWESPGDDAVVRAVALGIRDVDERHLHTVELDYLVSGSLDDPTWAPIIDVNASYTYYPTYAQVLADYDRPDAPPTFMVEANYEFEHNAADLGTPEILRRQEYWTMLSGAAGHYYGNAYTWPFRSDWQDNLDTVGSSQIAYVNRLFLALPWWNLVPDEGHAAVTAGTGTFADDGSLGANDYATAARTPDGAWIVAYMPTIRAITVDMSRLGSAADAAWYDPSDGSQRPVAGSPFPNAGSRSFTPPGANADGDGDWVLVLHAAAVPPDVAPPSVPSGLAASDVTSTTARVSWAASTDGVAVAGYRVYRDGAPLRTTRSTSLADSGLSPSTAYEYRVSAFDYESNESAPSAPLVVTTRGPEPTFVQQAFATPQSPQSSVAVAFAEAQSAGHANLVAIGWNDVTANLVSLTDSVGNVYVPAVATLRGNGLSQAIYYASSIAAAPAGANVVTATFDRAAVFVDLRVLEYAFVRASGAFEGSVGATGSGSLASTGSLAVSGASRLLFAAGMTSGVFTGPGAGFTVRVITSPDGDIVEDAITPAAASYAASAPLSGGTWLLQLAAFRGQ